MLRPLIDQVCEYVAEASGATTVDALMTPRYGEGRVPIGLAIRVHTGSGNVSIVDTKGQAQTFALSGPGDSVVFAFTEITAITGGMVVKVFA
jgi:hypothetical protein